MQTKVNTPPTAHNRTTSLTVERFFSKEGIHPYMTVDWENRSASISGDGGEAIFQQENIEIPKNFSELATKILASKYFYGDITQGTDPKTGGRESSLKQVLDRVCGTIERWGREDGYFADAGTARIFREELTALCLTQSAAFNSPVWFNLGLYQSYGIGAGSAQGNHYWNPELEAVARAKSQYEYPQCSACFIQKVDDNLESIMDLARAEAMLFKFGSGSGTDLSSIRSSREKLSGGGRPSGPLSFLAVYDSVAGVVKSGGKTRRAAKMNVLKARHPDIEEFIDAKRSEEMKAWALIEQGYDPGFNGEAYGSILFQNENLSVRASDEFMSAATDNDDSTWWTRRVSDGSKCEKKDAKVLLRKIAEGTHLCGDPGMQFDDNIHKWHTCKGSGRQNCTNPCSEYLFLDDSACNLASINLMKFIKEDEFDVENFARACRILIIAQDILVDRSSYPTEAIAYNSHWFRTLGLGYANLGGLLMSLGLAYDSEEGRAYAAGITAVMTGAAYQASVEMAQLRGPFSGYLDSRPHGVSETTSSPDNVAAMQEVIERHRSYAAALSPRCPAAITAFARQIWEEVGREGAEVGYRNAQVTVLAPTGTIGFLMDCDTTGIEPAIGLVAYKQLAGGGSLTLPIQTVPKALEKLGYDAETITRVRDHIKQYGTVEPIRKGEKTIESGLRTEHLPVFDTAFRSGMGERSLSWISHLRMMADVQPFLSGGISKTVNMPNNATVDDIVEAYTEAWKLGIKGVAIYRDGSKRSAPIQTSKTEKKGDERAVQLTTEPYRRRLPDTRQSLTHKFSIGGSEGYLTVGKFEDGSPGEVFLQMSKAGSTVNGLMDTIGILLSLCLQFGVPLESVVKKFSHVRFEPEGMSRNKDIPIAKSVVDYLGRWLGMEFIDGYRERMSPALADKLSNGRVMEAPTETSSRLSESQMELLTESEGNLTCPECGSNRVKVTGTCACCMNCGTSLGCS